MSRFLDLVCDHPVWILTAVALLSVAAAAGLYDRDAGRLRLEVDPSVDRLLPEGDPERQLYRQVRRIFGDDETALVALATEDAFTAKTLRQVERITQRFEELPGVKRVLSLATAPNLRFDDEGIVFDSFTGVPEDPVELDRLREDVRKNPLYRGVLVSEDERVAAFVVTFGRVTDRDFVERDYPALFRSIASEEAPDAQMWVTGAPLIKANTTRMLLRSLAIALPAIGALGALTLLVAFASVRSALLAMTSIAVAVLWTLGTLGWLGRPLNLVTVIAPPLVITLGLAYVMHVLADYHRAVEDGPEGADPSAPVRESQRHVAMPLLIAGLTTAAGLVALAASPLAAVREFGLLSALGVVYVTVLCFSMIPAGLSILGPAGRPRALPARGAFASLSARLGALAIHHRRQIVALGVAVLVIGGLAGTRIQVGAGLIRDYPPDAPLRLDYEAIGAAFGAADSFSVFVETNLRDAFTDPEILADLADLQAWLDEQPEIAGTTSVVDHLKLVNRAVHGDPERFAIPESGRLSKQLLVFAAGEEVERYVDLLFHSTNIAVRADVESSTALASLLTRVEERLGALPLPLQAQVTGGSVLLARAVDRIARGQILSIVAALAVIYAILAALFTSFRVGLLALVPNAVPIAFFFGLLGITGVPLNPSSSLIACIALGLAVDDTIHYLVRFQAEAQRHASEEEATRRALRGVIRPITFTTVALCLGFLTLTSSELRNQVQFGTLAASTLALAWVVDVTLTPALCAGIRIVTFWDVLRVDLGHDPQHSIPVMRGLSQREARTVALILDMREFAAGEAVVRQGEPLTDFFVVIEGELAAWVERDGRRMDLYRATRGDVVGEVSYFSSASPANIVAVSPARLLRFEDSDLEYLVERHPRIAAHIYRNLNLSQARRLVDSLR